MFVNSGGPTRWPIRIIQRYYDANIGRFTQPDPSGQEKNPYLYTEGDPVNRIDPNGLFSFPDVSGALEFGKLPYETITGDEDAAFATKVGILTAAGTEALCLTAAAAGSAPTLGASVGAGITGCHVLAAGLGGAAAAGTAAARSYSSTEKSDRRGSKVAGDARRGVPGPRVGEGG
ncbi:RHS repeat-associated core domain-containing protein [Streptomyces sp. NPDC004830]